MPKPAPTSHRVEFSEFEVDLRAGELYRSGHKVKIQERPFQVLSILLQQAGEIVTREELRQRIWPADIFVGFDHSLAVAVNKLREALRDSADKPRFVETVGRRGYRFLVPVDPAQLLPAGNIQLQTAPPPSPLERAPARRRGRVALAGSGFVLLLVLVFFLMRDWRRREAESAPLRISSIAVLPLKNLSNDPGQDYFAEGMTDELITDLAKLPGLRVISHTSSMCYRDTHKMMREIGRELNVDAVVEGTVARSGDRVRIRTQLIYAPSDQHIWAEAYERDLKDVLVLQAALAKDIASEIRLTLTSQHQASLTASHSVDPEAHELYLKGRYFWNKRDQEGFNKAIGYFQQAVAKDPGYAAAYSGLADAYVLSAGYQFVPIAEVMPKAKAAAEKGLELDINLAEAHTSLGLIAPFFDWNWADAKRHYERAIALNPNYATAHHWYGDRHLMPMGRVADALAEIRNAQALDPLSPIIITDLGKDLYFARRYDEAVVEFRRALEIDPNFVAAHNWLSDTFLEKKMYLEARAELEKTKPFKEERIYIRQTAYLYARTGRRAEARRALAKSLQLSRGKQVSSGAVALVYAALGDKDRAFLWLGKACAVRSSFMTTLKFWSVFDILRSDRRFKELVRRVGLTPE
jgi:TolB-like protein/DNA-binding winged helix-turn-helix (wHTH) protein/Tfp pilus assembly protein PilF